MLGSGIALNPLQGFMGCNHGNDQNINFGLQLYTLRDVLPADPKGILTQVASFGYKEIESYEGDTGMFWGLGNTGMKKLMDDLGMKLVASHASIESNFEQKVEKAAAIGMNYLLCPWLGPQKNMDVFKTSAETFNKCGETCKKYGLRFGYHNHDYSFRPLEGQFPQDILMQNTDKDLVDFEMDIYWVVTAGQDPVAWINKYPGRFRLAHIKDRKKNIPKTTTDASTTLGTGEINFSEILKVASKNGMQHYLVEQELFDNTTPMEATRKDAEFMKTIKL